MPIIDAMFTINPFKSFRHLLEYGFSIIGTSTLWFMFRYKKAFIDPPPEKAETDGKKKGENKTKIAETLSWKDLSFFRSQSILKKWIKDNLNFKIPYSIAS